MKKPTWKVRIAVLTVALAIIIASECYKTFYKSNLTEDAVVFIPTGSAGSEIIADVKLRVKDAKSLERAFRLASRYKKNMNVRAGKVILPKGKGNYDILKLLLHGRREEVNVTFNSLTTLEELASLVSRQIEADSASIMNYMQSEEFLNKTKLGREGVKAVFLPDTYRFFWNSSAKTFVEKCYKEYLKFWNEDRMAKAEKINLSRLEVSTLASIVEKETSKADEHPRVAGLYINRLKKNIRLQSDPTALYALRINGMPYKVKRVLYSDLKTDSPYNTYIVSGLPPAPINIPQKRTIDAVLNAENHNYIYMVASVERFGYHEFGRTHSEHEVNKRKYTRWLRENNIKR